MTSFDTTRTTYGTDVTANRISGFFAGLSTAITAWNDTRKTARALGGLTDRELADIGLTRGDITNVAKSDFIR